MFDTTKVTINKVRELFCICLLKSKDQQRNLRRKCKENYKINLGVLFYHSKRNNDWKQVPRSREQCDRVIESCHSLLEVNIEC